MLERVKQCSTALYYSLQYALLMLVHSHTVNWVILISFAAPQRYSNSMSSSAGMRAHTGARLTADTALELGRVRLGRRLIMAQMTQQQPNPSAATTPAIETQVRR